MDIALVILRRALSMLVVLVLILIVTFFVTRLLPGDPAAALAGIGASPEQIQIVRDRLGVDLPLPAQFGEYLASIARFDFGTSIRTRQDIGTEVMARLPATLELALFATIVFVLISIGASLLASRSGSRGLSSSVRVLSVIGSSAPVYWLALVLQLVFYGWLAWLPSGQRLPLGWPAPPRVTGFYTVDSLIAGDPATFWQSVVFLILPVAALSLAGIGSLTRLLRAQIIDEERADYITTVRAKGVSENRILLRHALPNALNPAITVIGIEFAFLVAGAIFVEKIFQWPGLGSYTWDAIVGLDYPVVSAVAITLGVVFVLTSFVVDLLYRFVDPRLRTT
jgi:peptide/nickel transport system permease protein